jgi:16S rRNA (guanine527-N7)-methyltransferase
VAAAAPPPASAAAVFGDRLPAAARYAELLTTVAVERGLIGPRETERIWERHVLNCAALAPLVDRGARVLDIGSGAGLPGIPLVLARPGCAVVLVESLQRRSTFLTEVIGELGLASEVSVVRSRAEELTGERGAADVVVARAVAPIDRLAGWAAPMLRAGGRLLALKGDAVDEEIRAAWPQLRRLGFAGQVTVFDVTSEPDAAGGLAAVPRGAWRDANGRGRTAGDSPEFAASDAEPVEQTRRMAVIASLVATRAASPPRGSVRQAARSPGTRAEPPGSGLG